jgi:hypothetical protein
VTARGLERLAASTSLKSIDLSRTPVTDDDIKSLSKMKTLEELSLSQTTIGNEGLAALEGMPELRILDLTDTKVTSTGLAPLARLPKLQVLALTWRKLTREDLMEMSWLKQLKTIVLNGVPLPESTMVQLRHLNPRTPFANLGVGKGFSSAHPDPLAMRLPVGIPATNTNPEMNEVPQLSATPRAVSSAPGQLAQGGVAASSRTVNMSNSPSVPVLATRAVHSTTDEFNTISSQPHPDRIDTSESTRSSATSETSALKGVNYRPGLGTLDGHLPSGATWDNTPQSAQLTAEPASKREAEKLLEVITLQSNPAHAGAFSGLSSMRELQRTETIASLNQLSIGDSKPAVPEEKDTPENNLGDFSVGVAPGK